MYPVSALHLSRDSLGNRKKNNLESVAKNSFFPVIHCRQNNVHIVTAVRTAWCSLCPLWQRIAGCLHTEQTDPDSQKYDAGITYHFTKMKPNWKKKIIAVCMSLSSILCLLLSLAYTLNKQLWSKIIRCLQCLTQWDPDLPSSVMITVAITSAFIC